MISNIELRLLRQFVAVGEELHFHRAARRLAMSQPPLTAAIKRLELEIGTKLIERGNRTVALTAAGTALLEEARELLARADNAAIVALDAAAGRIGTARLGYVGSAMYGRLPSVVRSFRQNHPNVKLELREATTAAQVTALRSGKLDVAILITPLIEKGGLVKQIFDKDRLAIAMPVAHRLAKRRKVGLSDVAKEPFVLWPAHEGRGFYDRVMSLCAAAGFAPDVTQEVHSMNGVLSLVAAETGISVVPASMASVRTTEIAYFPLTDDRAFFELVACRRADVTSVVGLTLFDFLRDTSLLS